MLKKFVESNGEIVEVPKYASGVVGQQPIFKSKSWFEYQSGVSLKSGGPGTMQGAFAFTRLVIEIEIYHNDDVARRLSFVTQP
jgi:uncharacterized protein affecting Mg2+/Co2+ transport